MRYDKDQLYEANMHSLRNIAREMGVKAPTRLKKRELINEILQIDSGVKRPCIRSNRGRPLKRDVEQVEKTSLFADETTLCLEEKIKKECIDSILEEIRKKLIKLL